MLLLNTSSSDPSLAPRAESSTAVNGWQGDVWKVLIYDKFCRDVISPLLRVGDLRKLGVTLHMLLLSERQSIPDVPAVYFVTPTEENVKHITEDIMHKLYDTYYLNFCYSVPRPLLESIAKVAIDADAVSTISKVYDQYLNFISLEHTLFSLNIKDSYVALKDPSLQEIQIKRNIDNVVNGLFSVLVTMGVVPIIRSPKGNAAEMIAATLDNKLRDHLQQLGRSNLFAQQSGGIASTFQRPVLIILDRDLDLPIMLHHTWTYQALVHDLLNMALNRITIELANEEGESSSRDPLQPRKPTKKTYDLDDSDKFWAMNTGSPFPKVAEEVEALLNQYKADVEELGKKAGVKIDPSQLAPDSLGVNTQGLASAIESLPELTERKKTIDTHTNIATALLKHIKDRELDNYFSIEENLLTKNFADKSAIASTISSTGKGLLMDKIRLLLIYYCLSDNAAAPDFEPLESMLIQAGADLSALKFLKKEKAFHAFSNTSLIARTASEFGGSMFTSLADKVYGSTMGLLSGVKNVLIADKMLRVTRVVDSIMDIKADTDNYTYFDPKVTPSRDWNSDYDASPQNLRHRFRRGADVSPEEYSMMPPNAKTADSSVPRTRTPFKEAVVFVVGGGNYVEYQNVQDWLKKPQQAFKKVVYGSTEMLTAEEFIRQLGAIGAKS